MIKGLTWYRRMVARLSMQRYGFNPRLVHVSF
jgi:hypothetical protein